MSSGVQMAPENSKTPVPGLSVEVGFPNLGKFRENHVIFLISVFVPQRATASGATKPQNHHHWIRWGRIAPLQANCSGLKRGCARREPKFGAAPRFRDFDKKHPKRRDLGGTSAGALIISTGNGFSELD